MRHANIDRIERRLPDLPMPANVALDENEKPSGPPTEGMRNITAIVGMAAASMGGLAQMCSSPTALGNVAAGNNATMPPASQRVSGLNAGALAGLAGGLARLGDLKKGGSPHPAPSSKAKPDSPKPAAAAPQKSDLLEPDWGKTPQRETSKVACDPESQSCPQTPVASGSDPIQSVPESST